MNLTSIGDLAHGFMLRRQSVQVKQDLARLSQELSTGQAADLTRHLGGSLTHLAAIDHDLAVLDGRQQVVTEAGIFTAAMQAALERVGQSAGDVSETVMAAITARGPTRFHSVAIEARGALDATISALNGEVAGRSLFAGAAVDARALAPADQVLNELRAALGGVTTAAGALAEADAFFNTPGGGFETLIYQGGATSVAAYQLGGGETVRADLRADDPALRQVMKHVALAALIDDPGLSLPDAEKAALLGGLSDGLLTGQDGVTRLRADLGFAEARIAQAASRIAAERTGLSLTRNELVSIDRFETASDLQAVQTQLETLYTITARSARLSLVNFLS